MKTRMSIGLLTLVVATSAVALDASSSAPEPDMLDRVMNSRFIQWLDRKLDESADLDRAEAIKTAHIVPRGAKPEFIIRRSGIDGRGDPVFEDGVSFNGHILNKGDSLSKAIAVFGPGYRKRPGQNGYWWDELGIHLVSSYRTPPSEWGRDGEEQFIDYIIIYTGAPKTPPPGIEPSPPLRFPGYLELDGVGIDEQSTKSDISALADREGLQGAHLYIYCFGKKPRVCHVGLLNPYTKGIIVEVNTVDDTQDRVSSLALVF